MNSILHSRTSKTDDRSFGYTTANRIIEQGRRWFRFACILDAAMRARIAPLGQTPTPRAVRAPAVDGPEGTHVHPPLPPRRQRPVVMTVHGSGPVNRYGGTFHTFFLKHGVGVLAYDERGYTSDPEAWREPDLANLSADVAAAVRFVTAQPEIDAERIGLFASSQGGWVAPPVTILALGP